MARIEVKRGEPEFVLTLNTREALAVSVLLGIAIGGDLFDLYNDLSNAVEAEIGPYAYGRATDAAHAQIDKPIDVDVIVAAAGLNKDDAA